jgi:choline transporter-like protein 2/4/5
MARQADIDDANKPENKMTEKGIKWDRSCTDILCCLVFLAFIVSMVGLSFIGFTQGDPMNMLTPFDS